jgi:hypothetical protein
MIMNKYHAKRTLVNGIVFHSGKEARRYQDLIVLERAGKIRDLELQKRFDLVINGIKICTYVGDFYYFDEADLPVLEDVKGYKTQIYRLKRKLVKALYGLDIVEI